MQMRADHTAFMYLLDFYPLYHNKIRSKNDMVLMSVKLIFGIKRCRMKKVDKL